MTHPLPPIFKAAQGIQRDIELAVRAMERFHRYHVGSDMRRDAATVVRVCHRAWWERANQAHWVNQLVWAIDALRLSLQFGCNLRAFRSFRQFEALILQAEDIGRQAGGWKRQLQHGQNAPVIKSGQRAETLSTHAAAAYAGANS